MTSVIDDRDIGNRIIQLVLQERTVEKNGYGKWIRIIAGNGIIRAFIGLDKSENVILQGVDRGPGTRIADKTAHIYTFFIFKAIIIEPFGRIIPQDDEV